MEKYRLYDIDSDLFENLVSLICSKILGAGTSVYAKGRDSGKDGSFEGKANEYPSKAEPWSGKFIVQAKHTTNPIAKCTDSDFKTILKKESIKIEKKVKSKEVDNYLLFTNRKLTGVKDEDLRAILKKSGVKNVAIIGIENINLYLNEYPEIVRKCKLNIIKHHFSFDSEDMKEVILKFYDARGTIIPPCKETALNFAHPGIKKKNSINNLSSDYYNYIEKNSIPYFNDIDRFLQNPRNKDIIEYYYCISDELNSRLSNLKKTYDCLDDIFQFIYDHIIDKHSELKSKRRLINVFLHYMYYHCDFGLGVS